MVIATTKVHWGKPIWVTTGGAELPVTNLAVALALALSGPGDFSLDRLFKMRVPRSLVVLAAFVEAGMVGYAIMNRPQQAPAQGEQASAATEVEQRVGAV